MLAGAVGGEAGSGVTKPGPLSMHSLEHALDHHLACCAQPAVAQPSPTHCTHTTPPLLPRS